MQGMSGNEGTKLAVNNQFTIGASAVYLRSIPEHALHEKGLQRQIGDGTLVSSQERRALAVLLMNRL